MDQNAPPFDLRIVRTDSLHPHEEHDHQRAIPLIERIKNEQYMINPPVVSPLGASQFLILDGANRCYTFQYLQYPHILVQVTSYDSGYVELRTWQHVISDWEPEALLEHLYNMGQLTIQSGQDTQALAHIILRDGRVFSLRAPVEATHEHNAILRDVVRIYQQNAKLYRTAIREPEEVWLLFPNAVALMLFPQYSPSDIIAAAKYQAFLPPGISRHIIYGRALRVNYPMALLRDTDTRLHEKNAALQKWLQAKLETRQIRYYAESTYQFDE